MKGLLLEAYRQVAIKRCLMPYGRALRWPPLGGGEGCSAYRYSPATRTENRLLNFRVYESHNERAAKKKIEMFNKGELAIFRRVGLTPVFFGETVVGAAMPNLTYLLVFPDEAGRKAAWNAIRRGRRTGRS